MAEERIEALIRELADFRARGEAMRELTMAGESAVEPLIAALNHRLEPVVWSAAQVLGQIGDERAVGPLIEALGRDRARGAIAAALGAITGRDFGEDVARWRRFAAGHDAEGPPAAKPPAAPVDPLALIEAAIEGSTITRERRSDLDFELTVPLKTGRRQRVRVLFNATDAEGEEVIVVYSECGPARRETYEWALRRNVTIPYAAFGIRDIQGAPNFVMVHTLLREGADPRELRKSIDSIAARADALEQALTKTDER